MRRFILTLALLGAALAAAAAPAAPTPVLKIVFPEGFTARKMADRVAEVRQIAIRKRGVTPLLTGASYAAATRVAKPPAAFRPFLKRAQCRGIPLSVDVLLRALVERDRPRGQADRDVRAALADGRPAGGEGAQADAVRRAHDRVDRRARDPGAAERKLVAAVVYNRLERGMPLAIDATIRYGLGIEGTRPIKSSHLRSSSPYNTHRFKGLPPTPIANPGLASMRAAAKPAAVDYLYYVRKPDGVHHFFTADEQEFCEKAREYGYGC